jgi:nucleoside-diphosphate-sugar epimerase
MKIFLTGHKGYVGNVLSKMLLEENFDVVGCDLEHFPQGFVENDTSKITSIKKDIRDLTKDDLKDCNAVLHLAALSNDPMGEINPKLTNDINFLATVKLAEIAKEAGVNRFVYSSSCSTYGANNDTVNEQSSLDPLTAYAKSKVDSEKALLKLKGNGFSPVILRNATAYGISSSLRLDLVVNNLVCAALSTGKVKLLSDGTSWRPLLHVEDMSKAFITCLKQSEEKVSGEIFNVGSNEDNYTVREIAEKVEKIVPNSIIEYSKTASKDSRSYRVNFDKITDKIGFKTKWNLDNGIKQIYETMKEKQLSENDLNDKNFHRVKYLKFLIENNTLNSNLELI